MLPENVRKACELAKLPGGCTYVADGKPACVIGQLAVLEGCTVEQLSDFEQDNLNVAVLFLLDEEPFKTKLAKYNSSFLDMLQMEWDSDPRLTNEKFILLAEKLYLEYENNHN